MQVLTVEPDKKSIYQGKKTVQDEFGDSLDAFPLDQIAPNQAWRILALVDPNAKPQTKPKPHTNRTSLWDSIYDRGVVEVDPYVYEYDTLSRWRAEELHAEWYVLACVCVRVTCVLFCCSARVAPGVYRRAQYVLPITAIALLLIHWSVVLLNLGYSSFAFNGYTPINSHCSGWSSTNCSSTAGVRDYGSLCYYSYGICFAASAPIITALSFVFMASLVPLLVGPYFIQDGVLFVVFVCSALLSSLVPCSVRVELSLSRQTVCNALLFSASCFVCSLCCFPASDSQSGKFEPMFLFAPSFVFAAVSSSVPWAASYQPGSLRPSSRQVCGSKLVADDVIACGLCAELSLVVCVINWIFAVWYLL